MDMLVTCTITGVAVVLLLLNIMALALCRSARQADRQAERDIELLTRKYDEQVRDNLRKEG